MSESVRKTVGDRPILDISVKSGDKKISSFNGIVTVSIPYNPKPDEDLSCIVVYFINSDGKLEAVNNCKYDATTGKVLFTTKHFSKYAIGYNKVIFTDVDSKADYSKAVDFISARGITNGTGNNLFSPNDKLSRSQFIVLIMRAFGVMPDLNPSDNFADAGNTYYTGYLSVAKRMGLSNGVGNNMFAPEQEVTNQEMYTLLFNTLKALNSLPSKRVGQTLSDFSDASSIASWATEPIGFFVQAGITNDRDRKLNPSELTTRAQMAQVIYKILISEME